MKNGREKTGQRQENYEQYRFSGKEWLLYPGLAAAGYTVLSLLLYASLWPFAAFPVVLMPYLYLIRQWRGGKRKHQLMEMFVPSMEAFVVELRAGYSAESALRECCRDMKKMAGEKDPMVRELLYMESQLAVSVPLEKLFLDLADRSGLEDIREFARVFAAGKRRGGGLDRILTVTVRHMKQKQETEKDIRAEIAARKTEQTMMSMVPPVILIYLRLTSPEYMAVFYTETAGRIVMTVCLAIYLLSWFWGRRITDIEV